MDLGERLTALNSYDWNHNQFKTKQKLINIQATKGDLRMLTTTWSAKTCQILLLQHRETISFTVTYSRRPPCLDLIRKIVHIFSLQPSWIKILNENSAFQPQVSHPSSCKQLSSSFQTPKQLYSFFYHPLLHTCTLSLFNHLTFT